MGEPIGKGQVTMTVTDIQISLMQDLEEVKWIAIAKTLSSYTAIMAASLLTTRSPPGEC